MGGECVPIGVKSLLKLIGDPVINYVSFIKKYDDNITTLGEKLDELQIRKSTIDTKLKTGMHKLEKVSGETARWLQTIRELTQGAQLKKFMMLDDNIAHHGMQLMEPKVLKRLLMEDKEIQEIVVRVLMQHRDDDQVGSATVARVVVDVMRNATEEFKNLIEADTKMAETALDVLGEDQLKYLEMYDREFAQNLKIARRNSDKKFLKNYVSEEEEVKDVSNDILKRKNKITDAAEIALKPVGNLVKPLGILLDDESFKKAVPTGLPEGLKYGLKVIEGLVSTGLKKEMKESIKRQSHRCCLAAIVYTFHEHYQLSKGAYNLAIEIQGIMIDKCPQQVCEPLNIQDLNPIPSGYMGGLESREELLQKIIEKLTEGQVNSVAVLGMGGAGKTTLAKEVYKRAKDLFGTKVMVVVSQTPNIERIQEEIGESIGLYLNDKRGVDLKAQLLYERFSSKEEENTTDSEKGKKVLIILDNIWSKLDLHTIGIPPKCNLLLTTREKKVCGDMDVRDDNIVQVGELSTAEARHLFKTQAGKELNDPAYNDVVERLLGKCGGLPLAIVAASNALKNKNLSLWRKFADELEKPIWSQVGNELGETYPILETSFRYLESNEKRMFFLLACLFPVSSSMLVEDLLRFGIGFGLFQYVNKLSEAREQAYKWVDELKSSSMFLDGNKEDCVKIHDVVHASAISFAVKDGGHRFLVETIPRWMNEAFNDYTAISLLCKANDFSFNEGVQAENLQILLIDGNKSMKFPSGCIQGMPNLKVLTLKSIIVKTDLSDSIGNLKKLRALHLEKCELEDIKAIGKLVDLLVLSLRESSVEEFPTEIGVLGKLLLLDLTGTKCKVSAGIIHKLSELEGLYMLNSVFVPGSNDEGTNNEAISSTIEFNSLQHLNALEMRIPNKQQLPSNTKFVNNLDNFRICVGGEGSHFSRYSFNRLLDIEAIDDIGRVLERSCLKALLKKADWLRLTNVNLERLVPGLDDEGLEELMSLNVAKCDNVKFIVSYSTNNDDLIGFPKLKSLTLGHLASLQYVMPLTFLSRKLTEIKVDDCGYLGHLFIENNAIDPFDERSPVTEVIELPTLRSLQLQKVTNLSGFSRPECSSSGSSQEIVFFNQKVTFPSLELFKLSGSDKVVRLWSKEFGSSSFNHLRTILLKKCNELSSIGPPSVFAALEELENLTIKKCSKIVEVICEKTELVENPIDPKSIIRFLKLKHLELFDLHNLVRFCEDSHPLEFPALKFLQLKMLDGMSSFTGLENQPTFFHEQIEFPCLKTLDVWQGEMQKMGLFTPNCLPKLKKLLLTHIKDIQFLFHVQTGFVGSCSQFPELKELGIWSCISLTDFFEEEVGKSDAASEFFDRLESLRLSYLPKLKVIIPQHLYKNLLSLRIEGVSWVYVTTANVLLGLQKSLQQLELLEIHSCKFMSYVIHDDVNGRDDDEDVVIKFPRLKIIDLKSLHFMGNISSTPPNATLSLPSLESLKIQECKKLKQFWSGSIIAPRLQTVTLYKCRVMESLLSGDGNHVLKLPSLKKVEIKDCPNMQSFSSTRLLRSQSIDISYNDKESRLQFGDLNNFLREPRLHDYSHL